MLCGLSLALSPIVIVADRLPVELGVKITSSVHVTPAATAVPQELVWEKSALFVPPTVIPVMFNSAVPPLFNVTDCTADAVPTI
jgi:hypothetical protein